MTEVEKLHGLHNTGMTMHERFTLLARQAVGRRPLQTRAPMSRRGKGRTNPALIEAIINQLNQAQKPIPEIPFRGRGRGGLRRYGSEGSLRSLPGVQRMRSNSVGFVDQDNKSQKWRQSNGNLSSYAGSINGSRMYSARSGGFWVRGDVMKRVGAVRGRTRGRGLRGRFRQGRVNRPMQQTGAVRPLRGTGRRGVRRNVAGRGARGQGRGRGGVRGRGRGRGGVFRKPAPKPVPTREELDAQLDQYMAGTKAALDKELDEYMRNAMDFE